MWWTTGGRQCRGGRWCEMVCVEVVQARVQVVVSSPSSSLDETCRHGGWVSVDGGGALAGAGAGGGHHRCRHVVGRVEMVVMA